MVRTAPSSAIRSTSARDAQRVPGVVLDAMHRGRHVGRDRLLCQLGGDVVLAGVEGRREAFADQRLTGGTVEEDGVAHVVVPLERRPHEADATRDDRRPDRDALTDAANAPRPVFGAAPAGLVDGELAVGVADGARPPSELGEAGRVHDASLALPQDLAGLLDGRRAGREREVAGDAGLVVVDDQPGAAERLGDLEPARAHREIGALLWRSARGVEAVLTTAGLDAAEVGVEDAPVRVHGDAEAEVARGVVAVAVEPGPVVEVRVRCRGMGERLGCSGGSGSRRAG